MVVDGYSVWQRDTKHNLNGIIWTGDQYICVGDSGTILKSNDGYAWTQVSFPASDNLKSIVKLDTMLLIRSGNPGSCFLTNNLLQTFEAKNNVIFEDGSITLFDNSIFFIDTLRVSQYEIIGKIVKISPQVNQSPVNVVWTPANEENSYNNYRLSSITSSPDRIIACGTYGVINSDGSGTLVPFVISSANGIDWDTVEIPALLNIHKVIWTGEQFIGCGAWGLSFSKDGVQWQSSIFNTGINTQRCLYGYEKVINSDSYTVLTVNGTSVPDTLPVGMPGWNQKFKVNSSAISSSAVVSVGDSANIATFSNIKKGWDRCTTSITSNLNAICSNGNMFVAVGDHGCIAVSQDGKLWDHSVLLYKDTTLSSFADFDIGLQGNINITSACTSSRCVVIEPGTTLKMAPGTHIVFNYLEGKGLKNNPIQFQASDPEQPWGGLSIRSGTLEYCNISGGIGKTFDDFIGSYGGLLFIYENVSFSHLYIITEDEQYYPVFHAYDGTFTAQAVNVKGKARIRASTGSSYTFYNSLFQDETDISVSSIQNNFPSYGYFNNCTFGRGCSMSASSDATEAVRLIATNCAFVSDVTGNHQYVGFYNCMYGDSLFADAAAGNFNLRAGTVAIDKGINEKIIYTTDLTGNPRIYGNAVDIGAIEYNPEVSKIASRESVKSTVSIMVHGRVLKLSLPPSNRHNCSVFINDYSGRLLWKCHIPSTQARSGNISVALPRLSKRIVLIRVNYDNENQFRKVLLL